MPVKKEGNESPSARRVRRQASLQAGGKHREAPRDQREANIPRAGHPVDSDKRYSS